MNSVFMDESGYTGPDLLNGDQPFQAASAITITDVEAEKLVKEFFPKLQAGELKHKQLSRRKTNWKSLLEIQKTIIDDYRGITFVCDKKYLLILLFLDDCIEPFLYENGINLFEDGQNYSLASVLYYAAPRLWGEQDFLKLLFLYQRASKTKLDLNIYLLIDHAKYLYQKGVELAENLIPLVLESTASINEIKTDSIGTDISYVVLLGLISHIEKFMDSEYEIIHDTSRNLLSYNKYLKQLIDFTDEITFHKTQITNISFPLKLNSVKQEDSKSSFGIQLADLLVGGVIENGMANKGIVQKNDYNQSVMEAYKDYSLIHLIPSLDFEATKEFFKGNQAQEYIDFIAKLHS